MKSEWIYGARNNNNRPSLSGAYIELELSTMHNGMEGGGGVVRRDASVAVSSEPN